MKKSRYSESQIISILKEAESGIPVAELCRKHGMSDATFYNWRSKYGGMDEVKGSDSFSHSKCHHQDTAIDSAPPLYCAHTRTRL